jgi:hypothetical protein
MLLVKDACLLGGCLRICSVLCYIYVYRYIYYFMYVCMYKHMQTYIHTHTHTHMHTCIHTYIHTYIYEGLDLQGCLAYAVRHTSAYVSIRQHTSAYVTTSSHIHIWGWICRAVSRMLYGIRHVCWRMLTYADVCWRMLTYASWRMEQLLWLDSGELVSERRESSSKARHPIQTGAYRNSTLSNFRPHTLVT